MKKLLIFILVLVGNLNLEAAPSHILVERSNGGFKLTVYGRLKDPSQTEALYIQDPAEISKIAGVDVIPEFELSKSPIRFWIHFADAGDPSKAEGSISQIEIHVIDAFIFSSKTIVPSVESSKDFVADIVEIIDAKPIGDK